MFTGFLGALTLPAMAADKPSSSSTVEQQQTQGEGPLLVRVSDEYFQQTRTVNDILTKTVVDSDGEKIGFVSDISIEYRIASSPAGDPQKRLSAKRQDKNGGDDPIEYARTQKDLQEGRSSGSVPIALSDSGAVRDSTTYAFISVGGFMGIGENTVHVPLAALSFNLEDDHLVLEGYQKSKIMTLAAEKGMNSDKASYRDGVSEEDSGEIRLGKRVLSDEESVSRIETALKANDTLRTDNKDQIFVKLEGDEMVLWGTVDSEQKKQRAGNIARINTLLEVRNDIRVLQ